MSFSVQRLRVPPSLIERSFDLPFDYRATFIWRRPDEPFEVRWSPDQPRFRKWRPQRKFVTACQAARARVLGRRGRGRRRHNFSSRGREVIVPSAEH
jgi:hypothetical protein